MVLQKLSINDEKISSQNLTVVHDTDSGESIEKTATILVSQIDEQKNANDNMTAATTAGVGAGTGPTADELSSDIVKSITEEIVEQATKAADIVEASSTVETDVELKSDVPSLMQVLTPENVVLPAQPVASDTSTVCDQ